MIACPEKLWVRVMNEKYVKNGSLFSTVVHASDSRSWKCIIRGRNVMELGARWQIGNGRSIDFWIDWWVGDKPLGLVHDIPDDLCDTKVCDLMTVAKSWDVEKLKAMLLTDVVR